MGLNCTIASLFLFQSIMWGNNITTFAFNYTYCIRDNNIDSTTSPPCIESLVTQGITDNAAYLSEAMK